MSWICPHLGLSGLGLPLVHGPAGVHSGTGVAADAPGQNRVPAPMLLLGRLFVSLCHLTKKRKTLVYQLQQFCGKCYRILFDGFIFKLQTKTIFQPWLVSTQYTVQ